MTENKITVTIVATFESTRILATIGPDEILKARLGPPSQAHRFAAATLLEGLSLWFQRPVRVVLSAESEEFSSGLGLSDGFGFGAKTVHYEVEVVARKPKRRGVRIDGIGDFYDVRQLRLRGMR